MPMKPGQRKCVETLDRPIVVAAGAGSGKTFTLTKRIVGAVQSGYVDDIGQVCAITFTNKAAAELKSRVKAELRACGLVEQSLKADDAWISTIHGMCARILRAHAVELDLDPSFQMADGTLVDRLRNQAVEEVLEAAEAGDKPIDCVGIYTLNEVNAVGMEITWTLELRADNTYVLSEAGVVEMSYTGSYTFDGEYASCGPINEESGPRGEAFGDGYISVWTIDPATQTCAHADLGNYSAA